MADRTRWDALAEELASDDQTRAETKTTKTSPVEVDRVVVTIGGEIVEPIPGTSPPRAAARNKGKKRKSKRFRSDMFNLPPPRPGSYVSGDFPPPPEPTTIVMTLAGEPLLTSKINLSASDLWSRTVTGTCTVLSADITKRDKTKAIHVLVRDSYTGRIIVVFEIEVRNECYSTPRYVEIEFVGREVDI